MIISAYCQMRYGIWAEISFTGEKSDNLLKIMIDIKVGWGNEDDFLLDNY